MRVRTRRRRIRLGAAERRARLLEAASRVLKRSGWREATVRDIVGEAGVSRGTFYLHFESKQRLLGAMAGEFLDRWLPPTPSRPEPVPDRERLESELRGLHLRVLQGFAADRATARLLFDEGAAADPLVARQVAAHDAAWRRAVVTLLSRARADGCLRRGTDVAFAAAAVIGAVQRVARALVVKDGRPDVDVLAADLARWHAAALV